eukprot:1387499-Rhodomonas_salina.1
MLFRGELLAGSSSSEGTASGCTIRGSTRAQSTSSSPGVIKVLQNLQFKSDINVAAFTPGDLEGSGDSEADRLP